ncbi:DHHA1 domain-containing protein [Clostridium sp. CCUG 7971]|uniref:alanyl-tRNA editing protein n=1 Tax=Clostridium sp. CCUG 7971 TaxID=2811414 RepID=UPI001ABB5F49|nr:DHHA1 domain-containing protein [Clostridium sp. CCUG 7971]MBO3445562.1 alanyl-tRNA editing protein AlaX-L [Clostridium sp. CCUG 7971]
MEKLYYTNQYIREFSAEIEEILEIKDKYHVLLDKTAFFPGGGGQFCDLGMVDVHNVLDVYEKDNKVYHILDKKPIKIHKVKCKIDWDRREDGMHQHFGQHVLSGSFYKLFNANTSAFHLGKDVSTVDINGHLTEEQIKAAELYANEVISQDIKVETLIPSRKELKKIWIRRDLPETADEIRIIKIGDLDSNACCGVHPKSTLDLKMIKIKRWEKNKGATRIEFLAGKRAINYSLQRDSYLTDICRYLSSNEDESINSIKKLKEKIEESINSNRKLEEALANYEIQDMIKSSKNIKNISVVNKIYTNENLKYVSKVAAKITEEENTIALIALKNDDKVNVVFAAAKNLTNINMNNLLKDALTLVDGRGGGSLYLAQGGGKNNGNLESALDYAFSKLEKSI